MSAGSVHPLVGNATKPGVLCFVPDLTRHVGAGCKPELGQPEESSAEILLYNAFFRYGVKMLEALMIEKTTYPIIDFLTWQRNGGLDLRPAYQRRTVWTSRTKSLLIDSILRGYPLPLIFLHNRLDVARATTVRQVVDGQQRLRTILAYIDLACLKDAEPLDEFSVMRSHNREYAGYSFEDLSEEVRSRILQTPLSVNVLPANVDDVTVLEIFRRMNSTGFKLNYQELRNAKFYGDFKEISYGLAYEQHQRWLRWDCFNAQQMSQMLEVEFVSDLLGLLLDGVLPRRRATIDGLYEKYDTSLPQRDALENLFRSTMDTIDSVFSREEMRTTALRRFRTTGWLYSIFSVVTAADIFDLLGEERPRRLNPGDPGPLDDPSALVALLAKADRALRDGTVSEKYLKALRGATSDRGSRQSRVDFLRSMA